MTDVSHPDSGPDPGPDHRRHRPRPGPHPDRLAAAVRPTGDGSVLAGRSGRSGRSGGDYLVSFDISSDRSRRMAGKALERFGPKLLYSVYGITVPRSRTDRPLVRINDLLDLSDHALVLPVCDRCDQAWWGRPIDPAPPGGWVAR